MALSDKQKQVVQQLRKEFEIKQQTVNSTCSHHIQHGLDVHSITIQTSTIPFVKSENLPIKPIPISANASVIIPNTLAVKVPSEQKPLYVASQLNAASRTDSSTPGVLNLAPTIRVPQYPPPQIRPSVVQNQVRPPSISPPAIARLSPLVEPDPPVVVSPKLKRVVNPDLLKVDFMAALGLITHETLSELQSRRSERKRRTTANPQFSYGNWDHSDRKRKSNHYLSSPVPPNFKRPRAGRPRIGSSPSNSRPVTPDDGSERGSPNGYANSVMRNGLLMDHDEICSICQTTGDLLNCDTCTQSFHRDCLEPSPHEMNPGTWMCPKCQLMKKMPLQWPGSLAMVHSYIAHKAAKEEEKRKLIKRSLELKAEFSQLEQKAQQLTETISLQMQQKTDLLSSSKNTKEKVEKLKTFIKHFQVS